jgi:superfamily I DNA/RNA helicase
VLNDSGITAIDLDVDAVRGNEPDAVTVTTLHRSKGLEYKAVAVVDAGDASIPLKSAVSRESEVDDLYRERDLLYVGMTRARDRLLVTWTGQPSRFLEDAMTAPGLAVVS